jgi:hypothetical protein
MSSLPTAKPSKRAAGIAEQLLLGAHVRLHSGAATGVIIARSSIEVDHVIVRWDDTGEVTNCLSVCPESC